MQLILIQVRMMFAPYWNLRDFKIALIFAVLGVIPTFGCISLSYPNFHNFFEDSLLLLALFIGSVVALVMLQLILLFLFPAAGRSISSLVWATVHAMVYTYSRIAIPKIPQIFYRLMETFSSMMMKMNNHIADSVKIQYSSTIKVANEISSQVQNLMIRYIHVRIIPPPPSPVFS